MTLYEIEISNGYTEARALKETEKIVKSFYSEDLQYLTNDIVNKYNLKAGMEKSEIKNWEEIKEEARFAENYLGISYMINTDKLDESALFFDNCTNELYSIEVVRDWEVKEYIYSYTQGTMYEILDIIEL